MIARRWDSVGEAWACSTSRERNTYRTRDGGFIDLLGLRLVAFGLRGGFTIGVANEVLLFSLIAWVGQSAHGYSVMLTRAR